MQYIFYFEDKLTPEAITFVYCLLLLFSVVSGLGTMFGGYGDPSFGGFLRELE